MRLDPNRKELLMAEQAREHGKRSRPASLLQYKATGEQTVPDVNGSYKRKPTREEFFRRQQQKQLEEQQHLLRPAHNKPTRAQGSGLPSRSYDRRFPSFEGMSEEEIKKVVEDPEQYMKHSPYYRDKDGNVIRDEPEHLRAMMEEGVPVKQWIALILLLAAGLYQLRKSMMGPNLADKNSKKPPSPRKSMQKSQKRGGKQKGKKTSNSKSQATRSAPKSEGKSEQTKQQKGNDANAQVKSEASCSVPILATEEESGTRMPEKESIAPEDVKEKEAAVPPVEAKKPKTSKKKKKTAKTTQPAKSKEDENLTADKDKQSQSPDVPSTDGTDTNHVGDSGGGETDGWKTVGQSVVSDTHTDKNGSGAPDAEDDVGKEQVRKQSADPKQEMPTDTAPVGGFAADVETNKNEKNGKVKKKNGKAKKNDSVKTQQPPPGFAAAPEASLTDDDAALALKLQEEEERLAKAFSQPANEDSWAEVTPKKSKRQSKEPVAGPAATAAH